MAKKSQWVTIGKRKIELSNLDKVLFLEDNILKAEVIEYYFTIAPTLLNHIKGRALTLIRFPDGIHGETFYQKNRPDWSPVWIEFEKLGKEEKKDYIIATEQASLVWLANLASLELHQLHSRRPNFDCPDYMVFDLDPPEGYDFQNVLPIAFELKEAIEKFGYTPFVKTTGGKGIHICCPLLPKHDFHTVFEAAQLIAQPFVDSNSNTTLHIKKEARKGRVLIDIYRIRSGQSIVSPYSLRGRVGAPVSMPLSWDDLAKVKSPSEFTIHNALELVTTKGDAWEGMDAYAVELHTHREMKNLASPLTPNRRRKTPEQLESYEKKRDFRKTPEPKAEIDISGGNNFVVHRHHASHLHYDLRLEQDGVLKSWAVPRGLPPHPGVKRLAVQTEDHPMEYLTFDGTIPKGQYGGGEMWIYALGKYQITKEKKDGFYFKLNSKEINAEYRIHKVKQKEWLMERVDEPQFNFLKAEIQPMLSESLDHPPTSNDYFYEVKWDGIRALISLEDGNITIKTRNQQNLTAQFPELLKADKSFRATCGLFDAEIVCLDKAGKPEFKKVIQRMQQTGATTIERLSKTLPVNCYVFDCLYLDGRPLINEPLAKRREWLRDAIKTNDSPYRLSEVEEDGNSLFAAAKIHGLEGIMAKRKDSKYLIGKRSDAWLKIKVRQSTECFIIGFTPGKGDRKATFGALQIAEQKEGALYYRGKVGTGFNDATMKEISKALKKLAVVKSHALQSGKIVDGKITTWIEPKLIAEISYARLTPDEMFREPVFLRLRPDLG